MKTYTVTVLRQGNIIKTHTIEAENALIACNRIEAYFYGEALDSSKVLDPHSHRIVNLSTWHGHTFEAREVRNQL